MVENYKVVNFNWIMHKKLITLICMDSLSALVRAMNYSLSEEMESGRTTKAVRRTEIDNAITVAQPGGSYLTHELYYNKENCPNKPATCHRTADYL